MTIPTEASCFFRFSIESLKKAQAQATEAIAHVSSTFIKDSLLSVLSILLVLSLAIYSLLRIMVAKPLSMLGQGFQQAAAGDLTVSTKVRFKDEIGDALLKFQFLYRYVKPDGRQYQRTGADIDRIFPLTE